MRVYIGVRREVAKAAPNHIKKGDIVWLGWTHEDGGFRWEHNGWPVHAKRFASAEAGCRVALHCHDPWYSDPDTKSMGVLPAHYDPPIPARLELL
jgi:hypothetical protein